MFSNIFVKNKISFFLLLLLIVTLLTIPACSTEKSSETITIGSKKFTEQIILGHILAELIEHHTDLKVERRVNLGATDVLMQAMKNQDIQLYVEYTGTALMTVLKKDMIADPEVVYQLVKNEYAEQFDYEWLEPLGFNNTHAMTVRQDFAEEHALEKCSDLIGLADTMIIGSPPEFNEREDGYKGFTNAYDIDFKELRSMDAGLMYTALREGHVDIINAFSTDGRIESFGFKVLEDDRAFFPPYYAAPLVRKDLLQANPELATIINMLAGLISEQEMSIMNAQVDSQGMREIEVAREFLLSKNLID